MQPFLSIITINYNNLSGVEKTVKSVENQFYNDFEYIMIDGASSDGSFEYLKNKKDNFSYIISEKDNGIYNAMNKGIKAAKGKYLLFLNSGDVLNGESALLDFINDIKFSGDIIYGDYKFLNGEKKYPDVLTPFKLFKASLPHQSSLIKRELFDIYGLYDEKFKIVSDKAFFIKCLLSNKVKFQHIKHFLSLVDLNGISNNLANKKHLEKETKIMLKEYFGLYYSDYIYLNEIEKEINLLKKQKNSFIISKILKKIRLTK